MQHAKITAEFIYRKKHLDIRVARKPGDGGWITSSVALTSSQHISTILAKLGSYDYFIKVYQGTKYTQTILAKLALKSIMFKPFWRS